MKFYRNFILMLFVISAFAGCSNKETSRIHFNSKPYNYILGENDSENIEIFLFKINDSDNRFCIQIRSKDSSKIVSDIRGSWDTKNGILFLFTDEKNKLIKISGANSYPRIIYSEVLEINNFMLDLSKTIHKYSGDIQKKEYSYHFDLKLFEKKKSIPFYIIPPDKQENNFFMTVSETKDGITISTEEIFGYWDIKEKILYLKTEDDIMYFKSERDTLELLNYENRYDLDKITLKK